MGQLTLQEKEIVVGTAESGPGYSPMSVTYPSIVSVCPTTHGVSRVTSPVDSTVMLLPTEEMKRTLIWGKILSMFVTFCVTERC